MSLFQELEKRRDEIIRLGASFGAENIRVFGSVAREEERPGSDIDILVSMQAGRSYFDLIRFKRNLEVVLHTRIDVLSDKGLYPVAKERILSEARPI
jgi:predicted nucleotidyltransferase